MRLRANQSTFHCNAMRQFRFYFDSRNPDRRYLARGVEFCRQWIACFLALCPHATPIHRVFSQGHLIGLEQGYFRSNSLNCRVVREFASAFYSRFLNDPEICEMELADARQFIPPHGSTGCIRHCCLHRIMGLASPKFLYHLL
jgi:hypothetical protein